MMTEPLWAKVFALQHTATHCNTLQHRMPTAPLWHCTILTHCNTLQHRMTTEPLWAAVFGSLLMGENLGISAWIGGGLILAACLVNTIDDAQVQEWKLKFGIAS